MILQAIEGIERIPYVKDIQCSPLYTTEPQEIQEQPWFFNCAAGIDLTERVPPLRLLHDLQSIEEHIGKYPKSGLKRRYGPRFIDLDLLLMGNVVVRMDDLVLPHPKMQERAFVLIPLLDLDSGLELPDGTKLESCLRELEYSLDQGRITQRKKV